MSETLQLGGSGRAFALWAVTLLIPAALVVLWAQSAGERLKGNEGSAAQVALASPAEEGYCSAELKAILRRVAGACGLLENGARGCKPTDAKSVAALSGSDFNALFKPLQSRARILQFDKDDVALDPGAQKLVETAWGDQRGASFFFVVARASPDGDAGYNQELSGKRAQAVLTHLEQKFQDPDLKSEVGLLWLGEEYAQLSEEFCSWDRSREGTCGSQDINRSAFVAWIDCAI